MIEGVPAGKRVVMDIPDLLHQLDHITRLAPHWEANPKKRNFFPMSALFAEMMLTEDVAGQAAFRNPVFNNALRRILQSWCCYLDSGDSRHVLNEGAKGWLSKPAFEYNKLEDFVIPDRQTPHWGWSSFNAFFHREIKTSKRRLAGPKDSKVIVSPNDGTLYRISHQVREADTFWAKGEPYSLRDILGGSAYLDRFVHGHVFQSYLSGADYHRWHAPVTGIVREAYVVDGLMFSNVVDDIKGVASQGYYTAVNTRGLTFIEADDPAIGMVCVVPIGITEVSSITLTARRGDTVQKGDQLGYFSYGGSSMAVLFEPSAIAEFTVKPPKQTGDETQPPSSTFQPLDVELKVNAQIARAN